MIINVIDIYANVKATVIEETKIHEIFIKKFASEIRQNRTKVAALKKYVIQKKIMSYYILKNT